MTAAAQITPFGLAWTPEEDAIVRENYQRLGAARTSVLTGRTVAAVEHRARLLNVLKRPRWSKDDDRRIRFLWGEKPVDEIAAALGRTYAGVCRRAYDLGLPFGVQPGFESLKAAARRTGFSQSALVKVLRQAKVPFARTMSWCGGAASYRWLMFDPLDVDDAVAQWMACEVVNAAAARVGVPAKRLGRWLAESGEDVPPKPRGKRRWRVPSDVIDRVVAARQGQGASGGPCPSP